MVPFQTIPITSSLPRVKYGGIVFWFVLKALGGGDRHSSHLCKEEILETEMLRAVGMVSANRTTHYVKHLCFTQSDRDCLTCRNCSHLTDQIHGLWDPDGILWYVFNLWTKNGSIKWLLVMACSLQHRMFSLSLIIQVQVCLLPVKPVLIFSQTHLSSHHSVFLSLLRFFIWFCFFSRRGVVKQLFWHCWVGGIWV